MITVVTHTRGVAPWIDICKNSVQSSLQGVHRVRVMKQDYAVERWKALQLDEFVCFVDDDDLVCEGSIDNCVKALQTYPKAGVAFTKQMEIDIYGRQLKVTPVARRPIDVAMSPQGIHHLAVLRTSMLDEAILETALKIGICFDWLSVAWLALRHGAVHVPEIGYQWRRYDWQDSAQKEQDFKEALPALRDCTISWMRNNEPFPVFA